MSWLQRLSSEARWQELFWSIRPCNSSQKDKLVGASHSAHGVDDRGYILRKSATKGCGDNDG